MRGGMVTRRFDVKFSRIFGDFKLLLNRERVPVELYNLAEDPLEFFNLVEREPAVVSRLTAACERIMASIETDPLRPDR